VNIAYCHPFLCMYHTPLALYVWTKTYESTHATNVSRPETHRRSDPLPHHFVQLGRGCPSHRNLRSPISLKRYCLNLSNQPNYHHIAKITLSLEYLNALLLLTSWFIIIEGNELIHSQESFQSNNHSTETLLLRRLLEFYADNIVDIINIDGIIGHTCILVNFPVLLNFTFAFE